MDILAVMRERSGDYDCPRCAVSLRGCELVMVRDDDPQFTVQVTCAACRSSFVVVLQVRDRTAHRTAVPDVVAGGAPSASPPIAADEMLDLHELLRDHRGSLVDLLKRSARTSAG